MKIVTVLTMIGNTILVLLLVWRGWSARLQWLTITSLLAVAADFIWFFLNTISAWLYDESRIIVVYWFFQVLFGLIVFEAWKANVKGLERLFVVQFSSSLICLFAHQHGYTHAVYQMENCNTVLNLLGIIWCIFRFRGEPRYEPSEARSEA